MVWHRLGHRCWRFVHVIAGAVGIFAPVMASAEAFTLLKRAGAVYLIWLGPRHGRKARSSIRSGGHTRCRTGILARHYCRGAEPEDGCNFLAFIPHLLHQPPMSPGSSSSLGRFQLPQHSRPCDRDLLGRHRMSWPGQAAVCRPQNATGIWCSDVHLGIFTSSFTSSCAAGRLIILKAILSIAACLPMLQHNLSADCSAKTTAFMKTTACISRSPRVALV